MKTPALSHPWVLSLTLALVFAFTGCASPALSTQTLDDYRTVLQAKVDAGEIPGAVFLLLRDGKVVREDAVGWRDREAKVPMTTDSIFRIASMTKAVTSAAVMILVDEGKVRLDDPLSKYVPEFAQVQVGVERAGPSGAPELFTEPPRKPIQVIDLMRHTSGLTYSFTGETLVHQRYKAARLSAAQSNEQLSVNLAKLPLLLQPGVRFEYGMSHDVLARVVEVASGMEFGAFLAARIFNPLAMVDSGFSVDATRYARIAEPQVDPKTGKRMDAADVKVPPRWTSGGGGMVSTARDYARFAQMLLNGGTLDGVRVLSKESVRQMMTNQLPAQLPADGEKTQYFFFDPSVDNGNGFGFGGAVRIAQGTNNIPGSIGDYSWSGGYGTYFWIDPSEHLVGVLMVQKFFVDAVPLWRTTREYTYRALGR
ncbi:MAG TPA: serine hydrolase domain-containing protein [Ramlibacter sp.]|nr:serine hydrolase domain-containing protein [Ramlibacter sp.]